MPGKRPTSATSLKSLPTRWAVGIIAVLIAYGLLQPVVNRQLGWQLPALGALQHNEPVDSLRPQVSDSPPNESLDPPADELSPPVPAAQRSGGRTTGNANAPATDQLGEAALLYGVLRETAKEEYLSPAGLLYTRGSAEGHRLKHIERHLTDDPQRPGKHGVFDGDMPQVIRWIDEAYELAKRGGPGTKKSAEDGRIIYEASLGKSIGFIGGRDGRRDNHPEARRLRLVIDGNKVITAFPF
jgi:hypothetical protein